MVSLIILNDPEVLLIPIESIESFWRNGFQLFKIVQA